MRNELRRPSPDHHKTSCQRGKQGASKITSINKGSCHQVCKYNRATFLFTYHHSGESVRLKTGQECVDFDDTFQCFVFIQRQFENRKNKTCGFEIGTSLSTILISLTICRQKEKASKTHTRSIYNRIQLCQLLNITPPSPPPKEKTSLFLSFKYP